jgi:hypothetical protein
MNKKIFGLILIFISLVIALVILYLIFFYQPATQTTTTTPPPTPVATQTTEVVEVIPTPKAPTGDVQPASTNEVSEESSRQVAINFTQRYGTYSNQSDLSRLNDLKFFVSPDYLQRLTQQLKDVNENYEVYSGFTTRVISERNLIAEDSRAVFIVTTKRTEIKPDAEAREFNQDIKISLIKTGKAWRVDDANWQ